MIPLFSRYALTRAQAEQQLGRELRGDPSRGERAALQALALLDFDKVRSLLAGKDIGDDFRQLVRERVEAAVRRGDKHFVVSVLVSGNAYDHYARQARLMGLDISGVLAAAVERDFARVREQSQLDGEPLMSELPRYVRELVELMKTGTDDPQLSARSHHHPAAAEARDAGETADPRGSPGSRRRRPGTLAEVALRVHSRQAVPPQPLTQGHPLRGARLPKLADRTRRQPLIAPRPEDTHESAARV